MKTTSHFNYFKHALFALLLGGAVTLANLGECQALFFEHLLITVSDQPPDRAETMELHTYLALFQSGDQVNALVGLEGFFTSHPASVWLPSLHSDLGFYYRQIGRDTLAL